MGKIEIIALPLFEKEIKLLYRKYPSIYKDFQQLLKELTENPVAGTSLGHNCFKIRMNITSKKAGKRGGARVITCVKRIASKLYLVSIFDKADRESISKEEISLILKKTGLV